MGIENSKEWLNLSQELGDIHKSLWELMRDVRESYFKKWIDRLKDFFGFWKNTRLEQTNTSYETDKISANIDTKKVDTRWFTPWLYPFAHITYPYKWIQQYRVDNVAIEPKIWFPQLALKWDEGDLVNLKVKNQTLRFANKNAIWVKKNNPCNVSPYKWDIWRTGSSTVADGQNHGRYESMEDWLASFMKLMRQPRYRNKSIQWINCSWMQWIYKENEPDSLKALRVIWITHASENLNVSPFDRLNTDDKETMMAFAQQTAIRETGSYFDRATLERAYNRAFA